MASIAAGEIRPVASAAKHERREAQTAWLLATPAIVLIVLFVLLPIVAVLFLGFTDFELGAGKFRFVGFENYAELFTDRTFRKSLWNTTVYTAIVAPISILLGLGVALVAGFTYVAIWEGYLAITHYRFMDDYTASILAAKRAEDLEEARAIDLRRLHQLGGKGLIEIAEEQRREAQTIDDMDEYQVHGRIAEAETQARDVLQHDAEAAERAQNGCHRQQHRLERNEAGKKHQAEDQRMARKPPLGQHKAVERAENGRDRHCRHDHLDRVPEIALDTGAGKADAGLTPGFEPGIERR